MVYTLDLEARARDVSALLIGWDEPHFTPQHIQHKIVRHQCYAKSPNFC
jgi:hypothetical protein